MIFLLSKVLSYLNKCIFLQKKIIVFTASFFHIFSLSASGRPFALSTSGGVSLGSYQAGQLYYQTMFLDHNKHFLSPVVITGASAGAINSFISIFNKCRSISSSPNKSIFWDTWKTIGLKRLTPSENEVNTISLFSTKSLEETASKLEKLWFKGFRKGCVTYFGSPMTFKDLDQININNGFGFQRQSAPVVLKITGRGYGEAPSVENFYVSKNKKLQVGLYLGGDDQQKFNEIKNVLFASSAFPLAFPSRKVRVCSNNEDCVFKNSEEKEFVDGGIYQNQPLALAHLISKKINIDKEIFYRHVDTDGKVYPEQLYPRLGKNSFIFNAIDLVEKFVTTSRNMELHNLMVYNPEIISRVSSSTSYYPRASDAWGAFFGFFDVGFREFDFLLGIYESRRELKDLLPTINRGRKGIEVSLPRLLNAKRRDDLGSNERLSCLSSYLENRKIDSCQSSDFENLRILTQLSLWRLYKNCSQVGIEKQKWKGCKGLAPFKYQKPVLSSKYFLEEFLSRDEEDDGSYIFRVLESLSFKFDSNEYEQDKPIKGQIREKLKSIIIKLAKSQKEEEQAVLIKGSKLALDLLKYEPPKSAAYLQFGELGIIGGQYSLFKQASWVKVDFGIDSFRISDYISNVGNETTFGPFLGPTFDLDFINSPIFQYQFGLAFSMNYPKDRRQCNTLAVFKDSILCEANILRFSTNLIYRDLIKISYIGRRSISGQTRNRFDSQMVVGFQFEL